MVSINSTTDVAFNGKVKKTPRGHEYSITHLSRNVGAGVGLLSGALVSHINVKRMKTTQGKRGFIQSLNNMGQDLSILGPVGKRKEFFKNGAILLSAGIVAVGMFVGAAIGGTVDSHNNQIRAKKADKTAEV